MHTFKSKPIPGQLPGTPNDCLLWGFCTM